MKKFLSISEIECDLDYDTDFQNSSNKEVSQSSMRLNIKNLFVCEKPILDWIDKKNNILDEFIPEFPNVIQNYHELFVGGGSVLFAMLNEVNCKHIKLKGKVYAYDISLHIINMYNNIQRYPLSVYDNLQVIFDEFNVVIEKSIFDSRDRSNYSIKRITIKHCHDKIKNIKPVPSKNNFNYKDLYYYWIRNEYNDMTKEDRASSRGTAIFIFLNKTCFRGIFRESPNGFNVTYGNGKDAINIDQGYLIRISILIKDVSFICCDFTMPFKNDSISEFDFVFFDPPKLSLKNPTYTEDIDTISVFGLDKHKILYKLCYIMSENNIKFMLLHVDTFFIREHFQVYDYSIRILNNELPLDLKRHKYGVTEIVIKNYNYIH